jgi:hypothetical protein
MKALEMTMRNQRSCSDENDGSEQERRDDECWHRHGVQLLGGSLSRVDIFRRSFGKHVHRLDAGTSGWLLPFGSRSQADPLKRIPTL